MTDRKLKTGGRTALGRGLSALISSPPVSIVPSSVPPQTQTHQSQSAKTVAAISAAVQQTPASDRIPGTHSTSPGDDSSKIVSFDRIAAERAAGADRFAATRIETSSSVAAETSTNKDVLSTFRAASFAPNESSSDQTEAETALGVRYVLTSLLRANPKQPRQDFSDAELSELASSLKAVGLLQPILVRPIGANSAASAADTSTAHFEIVAGERRWRAAQRAGLQQVPVIIRELSDRETLELALIENLQRENLNPVEHAFAYQRLAQEFGLNQSEIAERVGKDRASVANFMRLLKLPDEVLALLREGAISMGHAKAILSLREPAAQMSLARRVVKDALSVRALESLVAKVVVLDTGRRSSGVLDLEGSPTSDSKPQGVRQRFPEVTDRLRRVLGTKVSILHTKSGRGRIEIEYFSEEELDRLADQLSRAPQQA